MLDFTALEREVFLGNMMILPGEIMILWWTMISLRENDHFIMDNGDLTAEKLGFRRRKFLILQGKKNMTLSRGMLEFYQGKIEILLGKLSF